LVIVVVFETTEAETLVREVRVATSDAEILVVEVDTFPSDVLVLESDEDRLLIEIDTVLSEVETAASDGVIDADSPLVRLFRV
jgi:hypothetical protein